MFLLYEESVEGPMDWLLFVFTAIRLRKAPFWDFNQITALSIGIETGLDSFLEEVNVDEEDLLATTATTLPILLSPAISAAQAYPNFALTIN